MTSQRQEKVNAGELRELEPALRHVVCDGAGFQLGLAHGADFSTHKMAYWEWWPEVKPIPSRVIVCVHGLTRTGRDFDALANDIVQRFKEPVRVICPDVAGRGRSDWLAQASNYNVGFYIADMLRLVEQLCLDAKQAGGALNRLDWIGTSMGGLIGLGYSAMPNVPLPIHSLVLNDVGPALEPSALGRIASYLGKMPVFHTQAEGAAYLREIAAGFGPHTPAQWLKLSLPQLRPLENGTFTLHYDPAIAKAQAQIGREALSASEEILWKIYDSLTARTLLIRGADSDLLSAATAQEMQQRGPQAELIEFEGVGHAPTLVDLYQRNVILDFLQNE